MCITKLVVYHFLDVCKLQFPNTKNYACFLILFYRYNPPFRYVYIFEKQPAICLIHNVQLIFMNKKCFQTIQYDCQGTCDSSPFV